MGSGFSLNCATDNVSNVLDALTRCTTFNNEKLPKQTKILLGELITRRSLYATCKQSKSLSTISLRKYYTAYMVTIIIFKTKNISSVFP